ncbi:hypothetical protein DH2020_036895 [Rehmannia glutinosa]|uniref:NADP-dependent oxidoreductase domain-containing protein n=1 Tax=Rehmannia glutinosa TaxID=99300 RepID=A0ABR0V4K8_REHGL
MAQRESPSFSSESINSLNSYRYYANELGSNNTRGFGFPGLKKRGHNLGSRSWIVIDPKGNSKIVELDKFTVMRLCSFPSRDLRLLDPLFINPSSILGREKAIVVSLEQIRCIIPADEVIWKNSLDGSVLQYKSELCKRLETSKDQYVTMEYVDMYLVHWPVRLKPWVCYPLPKEDDFEKLDMETTWAGMEKCLEMGLCRGIGVSNFSCKKIENLLDFASVVPAVNQVEMHPMWRQKKLRDFCRDHKIHVSAYSALGGPGNFWGSTDVVQNPIIQSIALKHKVTPAQVALRWGLSKGASVIVKSFNEERLKENMGALDLKLEDNDILEIEKMEERKIMRGNSMSVKEQALIEPTWEQIIDEHNTGNDSGDDNESDLNYNDDSVSQYLSDYESDDNFEVDNWSDVGFTNETLGKSSSNKEFKVPDDPTEQPKLEKGVRDSGSKHGPRGDMF